VLADAELARQDKGEAAIYGMNVEIKKSKYQWVTEHWWEHKNSQAVPLILFF
jgi:hypothetical protein